MQSPCRVRVEPVYRANPRAMPRSARTKRRRADRARSRGRHAAQSENKAAPCRPSGIARAPSPTSACSGARLSRLGATRAWPGSYGPCEIEYSTRWYPRGGLIKPFGGLLAGAQQARIGLVAARKAQRLGNPRICSDARDIPELWCLAPGRLRARTLLRSREGGNLVAGGRAAAQRQDPFVSGLRRF